MKLPFSSHCLMEGTTYNIYIYIYIYICIYLYVFSAILYKLLGESTEPNAIDTLKLETQAKKPLVINIPVNNWLKQTQRFNVEWKAEGNIDPAVFIRGANTFDVGGDLEKVFKLNFLAYKVELVKFRVTFTNKTTSEYIYFNMVYYNNYIYIYRKFQ